MTLPSTRRDFLRLSAAGALMLGGIPARAEEAPPLRVGFVGVGARGLGLLRTFLSVPGVEVLAVCDIDADALARAVALVEAMSGRKPAAYGRNQLDYRRLCERDDLDLVINATPWSFHLPVSLAAMRAGKHVATEVPAATTVDACWELVETSRRTGRWCTLLENTCYFRNVMMLSVMVRQGLFGELTHCEAGYQHDTRYADFSPEGELLWRGEEAAARNGNLYPTHPVGPVAQWMDIHRGDRFDYLVSMSTESKGLNLYAAEHLGERHPLARRQYAQGDINTSLIRTKRGRTITLYFDTQSPRPYDLIYRVQGTRGIYMGTLDKICLEGAGPGHEAWESMDAYREEYEHPLWQRYGETAASFGHGGADYVMARRLVECLQAGRAPDIDVYDAAAWSVISPLSERSVAHRSRPVEFPDFTRGAWRRTPVAVPGP